MRNIKSIITVLIVILLAGFLCVAVNYFLIDRTVRYFLSGEYSRDFNKAISGGRIERFSFYRIPEIYSLDGEYSEIYASDLAKLRVKNGLIVDAEIDELGDSKVRRYLLLIK